MPAVWETEKHYPFFQFQKTTNQPKQNTTILILKQFFFLFTLFFFHVVPEPIKTSLSQPQPAGTGTSTSTSTIPNSSNGKRASANGQQAAASRYLPREVPPRFRQQEQKQLLKRGQPLPTGTLSGTSPAPATGQAGASPPPTQQGAGGQHHPSKTQTGKDQNPGGYQLFSVVMPSTIGVSVAKIEVMLRVVFKQQDLK